LITSGKRVLWFSIKGFRVGFEQFTMSK
jgi:hypothetical protein